MATERFKVAHERFKLAAERFNVAADRFKLAPERFKLAHVGCGNWHLNSLPDGTTSIKGVIHAQGLTSYIPFVRVAHFEECATVEDGFNLVLWTPRGCCSSEAGGQ